MKVYVGGEAWECTCVSEVKCGMEWVKRNVFRGCSVKNL